MIAAVSELQLAVLETLWRLGSASVNTVLQQIEYGRPLARTTVATVLTRMRDQGLVRENSAVSPSRFQALVSRDEVRETMVDTLVDSAFSGSRSELVNHLLGDSGVEREEIDRIVELLRSHEANRKEKKNA